MIDIITYTICGIIFFIMIVAFIFRLFSHVKGRPVGPITALAPSAVISLGIFGTFLGIYIGLMDFNTADINNSIPNLLEGLKTAFITSLSGMAAALILKYIYSNFDRRDIKKESIASEDPNVLLRQISVGISTLSETVLSLGETISNLFRSDEEYSIISQMKLIRTDMNDLKREVMNTLREFGEKVAELGTEAMIEALREVIEQFNARLNDLVGAEFKQLKDAMVKLVEWQENYREAVDTMQAQLSDYLAHLELTTELLEKSSHSISQASDHLDSIDGSLSVISVSAEDIQHHVEQLKLQNQQLNEFIDSIGKLGEEAKSVLPTISQHIEASTSELVKASEEARDQLNTAGASLGETVEGVASKMDEFTKLHAEQVNTSIEQIQQNLEQVLNESLTSLAGQLASLSNKFAEDYTPLADQLRNVVRIAEQINDDRTKPI